MFKIMMLVLMMFTISVLTTSAFAQNIPTVEIIISSETYKFGDKLEYQIIVSEVTNENAVIYIIDESDIRSQLLTMPIEIQNTVVTAQFPFDSIVWKEGQYILELEYSGASSITTFSLIDDGSVSLPFWFRDVTMMWLNDEATDKDYVRNVIVQLIDEGVINEPHPPYLDEDVIFIPKWFKTVAGWWSVGYMTDTQLVNNLKFLLEKDIIVISDAQLIQD
ncbi:hypothetical protein OAK01_04605 [Candidatus Nitrosopelagicus sp.]|nr:hypothetical protein [Candidatus Nitrosopelagicus sp.]